jgi:hypothetical protein
MGFVVYQPQRLSVVSLIEETETVALLLLQDLPQGVLEIGCVQLIEMLGSII